MTTMTLNDFSKELLNLKSAVIFCHARPDGDTLSCAFALYYAFLKLDKPCKIVCTDKVAPSNLGWIPFEPSQTLEGDYDGYIAVDTPTLEHLGRFADAFSKKRKTFAIDHHSTNTRYAKYDFILNKPSCTLVIFEIFKRIGVQIDIIIAEYLLTGLITDTNNFSVAGLDGEVFKAVSEFLHLGANFTKVYDNVVRNVSKEKAQIFGKALTKIRYFLDDRLAIMTVSQADLKDVGATEDATIGLVDYLTKISGVDVGVSLLEAKPNFYRISFRSHKTDVAEIASVFGGGGHKNASGAVLSGYYEDVIDKLVFNIGNYLL